VSIIGSLEDLSLADIIQVIAGSQKTGVLFVNSNEGRSSIVFKNGYVVSASKPDLANRLGQLLLKQGEISDVALETCLHDQSQTGSPLGEILLKRSMITPDKLRSYMKQQVVETVNEIVNLGKGSFSFQTDAQLPADLVLFDPQHILLDVAYLQDTQRALVGQVAEEPFSPSTLITEIGEDDQPSSSDRSLKSVDLGCVHLLRELSEELARPSESTEVSLLILRLAGEFFDRSLFFVLSDGALIACGGFGFPLQPTRDRQIPNQARIPLSDSSIFKSVYETHHLYRGVLLDGEWGTVLISKLADRLPNEIVVLPIISQEEVIAILYGDNGVSQQRIHSTDLLEVLVCQAGMALENKTLREKLIKLTEGFQENQTHG
jgi:uncharacterized protein DUF4388